MIFETLEVPLDECLGVEADWITRTDDAIGDRDQQLDGGIVGAENVKAPAANRISFHEVEKLVVTVAA